jgi:hypothetical protein
MRFLMTHCLKKFRNSKPWMWHSRIAGRFAGRKVDELGDLKSSSKLPCRESIGVGFGMGFTQGQMILDLPNAL